MTSIYEYFGVEENATAEELKKAYKKKLFTEHPDHGGTHEGFIQLQRLYTTITTKRKAYDEWLRRQRPPEQESPGKVFSQVEIKAVLRCATEEQLSQELARRHAERARQSQRSQDIHDMFRRAGFNSGFTHTEGWGFNF